MAQKITLGITTSAIAEVALVTDRQSAVGAATQPGQALTTLIPLVRQAFREAGVGIDDVSLVAVCTGPGSFTGLRIGVAFAKSLAQTRKIPVIGVSAYDVAEFGVREYPTIAIAKGKTDYYYARIRTSPNASAEFIQGDKAAILDAAARATSAVGKTSLVLGTDFSFPSPGERAKSVALLGRIAADRLSGKWSDVHIDYGQRPNAVVNWEKRQEQARGRPFQPREVRDGESSSADS